MAKATFVAIILTALWLLSPCGAKKDEGKKRVSSSMKAVVRSSRARTSLENRRRDSNESVARTNSAPAANV